MTPSHSIACFYDVGFGARAVSRKTPIYFIFCPRFFQGLIFMSQWKKVGSIHQMTKLEEEGGLGDVITNFPLRESGCFEFSDRRRNDLRARQNLRSSGQSPNLIFSLRLSPRKGQFDSVHFQIQSKDEQSDSLCSDWRGREGLGNWSAGKNSSCKDWETSCGRSCRWDVQVNWHLWLLIWVFKKS